jgi:DNA-binding NarL/FixJ family response regulator
MIFIGTTAVKRRCPEQPSNGVLMDLVMPELDGISATRQVVALSLGTRVIALTRFLEDDKVIPAIQAGATSFRLWLANRWIRYLAPPHPCARLNPT